MSDVVPYLGRLRSKRFHASSSRKLVQQQKRKGITEEGEKSFFSPRPFPLPFFFFCSRSNVRVITRLETLATQAINYLGQATSA